MKTIILLFLLQFNFLQLKASENFDQLDSYLRRLGDQGIPSEVLIAKGNEIVFQNSYGIKPGSAFYIASISKLFTASAIYKLEQSNKIGINDSLPMFFSNVPEDKMNITIKHLLTHQSGLQSTSYDHLVENIFDKNEALETILQSKLLFSPGTDEEYSSDGYSLLAIIIEKVTGMTFEEFMRTEIFSEAGMSSTGFVGDSTKWTDGAAADMKYGLIDFKGSPQYLRRDWSKKGGAGMISTASDMFAFSRSGLGVYDFYWSQMTTAGGNIINFSSGDDDAIGHNALFIKYPGKDITVIILTNSGLISGVSASNIISIKVDEALSGILVTGKLNTDNTYKNLSKDIAGKYYTTMGDSAEITNVNGRDIFSASGQELINTISCTYGEIYNSINEKAELIINSLKQNDSAEVTRLITNKITALKLFNFWKGLLKKYGDPTAIIIKGTSKVWWYPSTYYSTWIELKFEKETKLYRFEWDRNENLQQLGGSSIKNPLTGIAVHNEKTENIVLDLGNNVLFKIKITGKGIKIIGEKEIELEKTAK